MDGGGRDRQIAEAFSQGLVIKETGPTLILGLSSFLFFFLPSSQYMQLTALPLSPDWSISEYSGNGLNRGPT